jgi:hypothetical protein
MHQYGDEGTHMSKEGVQPELPPQAALYTFDGAMADLTRRTAAAVAAAYDFAPLRTIVDVGGGNGALLSGILRAYPHLHGTVFDQPHAAERARQQIAASGLAERCEAVGGGGRPVSTEP